MIEKEHEERQEEKIPDAEFVLSKGKVLERYSELKDLADVISYSSKTNPGVAQILEENTDCMFSIHLFHELENIGDLSRVIFLAQGWDKWTITDLLKRGILNFVVDNERDLDILLGFLRDGQNEMFLEGKKINLLLRMKLREFSVKTERYFVFGMSSESISQRIDEISEDDKLKNKVEKVGIHFHRKTQNLSEWDLCKELEDNLGRSLEKIDVVNIGGGLPVEYANTNIGIMKNIIAKIKETKQWLNSKKIDMIIEPGRYISAPSIKLVTRVMAVYDNNIIVNASVYNSDLDALIVPVKLLIESEVSKDEGKPYVVKGITPCSLDIFRYRAYFKEIRRGDNIVFLNAGAYNFWSDFCNLPKIVTKIVD